MRSILTVCLFLLPLGACATSASGGLDEAPATALEPAGRYDITFQLGGNLRSGTMTVTRAGEAYTGSMQVEGLPPATITDARMVSGSVMEVEVRLPEGPATMTLEFDDSQTFNGTLVAGAQRLPVRGRKTR